MGFSSMLVSRLARKDARQAGRAFDAGEDSADEDGIETEMYESSKHFRVAHNR
jgi:hypothetical protein